MTEISKLIGLKRQAKKDGWLRYINTGCDEYALMQGYTFNHRAAEHVCTFFEKFLVLPKQQTPFILLDWQRFDILHPLFGWMRPDGTRRFREGYCEIPKKNGKLVCVSTAIPTPDGWSIMGELKVGGKVFDEQGNVCNVTAVSEIDYNPESYEMEFSTGEKIKACADHDWVTTRLFNQKGRKGKQDKRKKKPSLYFRQVKRNKDGSYKGPFYAFASLHKGQVYICRKDDPQLQAKFNYLTDADLKKYPLNKDLHTGSVTTKQIYNTLKRNDGACNHRIKMPLPLQCKEIALPIEPYLLGVWLGDGTKSEPVITFGDSKTQIIKEIGKESQNKSFFLDKKEYGTGIYRFRIKNRDGTKTNIFKSLLINNNLLNNKHIPKEYLRASIEQRLSLLQGLMDTDGYCSTSGLCIEFSTSIKELKDNVSELLWSLGIKHSVKVKELSKKNKNHNNSYRLQFFKYSDFPVFRLKRKLDRMLNRGTNSYSVSRSENIHITNVTPCDSVPMKCIQVDSPSKQYLCGNTFIPTHNSTFAAGVGLYMLFGDGEKGSEVYCCANARDQANIVWNIAAGMVELSPYINNLADLVPSRYRIIKDSQSYFLSWSSDHSSKDGPDIHCAICDELHEWGGAGREFFDKIKYGGAARKQPICPLVITTAGSDRFSLCFELHTTARQILDGVITNQLSFFPKIYGVSRKKIESDPDYWKSKNAWKEANPSYGEILNPDMFIDNVRECENDPAKKAAFLRYRLGYWTESESPWIDMNVWRENEGVLDESWFEGKQCFVGLDLASKEDTTAISYMFPYKKTNEGKIFYKIKVKIFCPKEKIKERSRKLGVRYDLWADQGYLIPTEGDVIDHEIVFDHILKDAEIYNIKELRYDRKGAEFIIATMQRKLPCIELIPFGQGMLSMSDPTKAFYRALKLKRCEHFNHPVLTWMAGNCVVEVDAHENEKLTKGKSKDKIDGVVATVMAFAGASIYEREPKKFSVYGAKDFDKLLPKL